MIQLTGLQLQMFIDEQFNDFFTSYPTSITSHQLSNLLGSNVKKIKQTI